MPVPDVLGWELPEAWDACREEGLAVEIIPTCDPRQGGISQPDPTDAFSDQTWRVVRVRETSAGHIELVVCAEAWLPGNVQS